MHPLLVHKHIMHAMQHTARVTCKDEAARWASEGGGGGAQGAGTLTPYTSGWAT